MGKFGALAILVLSFAVQAHAFYNDSDVVELEGEAPQTAPGEGDLGAGSGGENPADDSDSGGSNSGNSGESNSSGSSSSGSNSSGGGSGASDTEDNSEEENVLDILVSAGALGGSGILESSILGDASFSETGGTILIDGERVRAALKDDADVRGLLDRWRGRLGELRARDYGLMAASTAISDRNIQNISFSAEKFEILYRSRGYLLAVIPISFPVRIAIVPQANEGRVTVRLPWYRFFVREFFTPAKLAEEIDAAMQNAIRDNTNPDADQRALLFDAVAQYLKRKVGTLSDSVLLGS